MLYFAVRHSLTAGMLFALTKQTFSRFLSLKSACAVFFIELESLSLKSTCNYGAGTLIRIGSDSFLLLK